jgi:ubiquinone/menaquinone biosynthesis C-methylase UbiE
MTSTSHPVFARLYPRMSQAMDQGGIAGHRRALLAGLAGEVIEIGAGDGKNFPRYPPAVTRVHAVEPEPRLRQLAQAAATKAPVRIEVTDDLAEQLPWPDASLDGAIFSCTLCTIADPGHALREAFRMLKPGGQLRFLEHVRAGTPGLVRVQQFLDASIWPVLFGGCHLSRDTATKIEHAGFVIDQLDRFLSPRRAPRSPSTSAAPPTGPEIARLSDMCFGRCPMIWLPPQSRPFPRGRLGGQWSQSSPRQASAPSRMASAAISRPTAGSSHHHPSQVLASSPAKTAAAR